MKRVFIAAIAAFLVSPVLADGWEFEVGYTTVNGDEADVGVDLGAMYGVGACEWTNESNYSRAAELLVALGVQDDDIFGVDVSLEPTLEAAYRGTWDTSSPDFQFFWRAAFARVEIEAEGFGGSESADETGFGLGVGAEWNGFVLGYTQYFGDLDDISRINIGYRFGGQKK